MFTFKLDKLVKLKKEEERIRIRYLNEVLSKINTIKAETDTIETSIAKSRMDLHKSIATNRHESTSLGMQSVYESNMNKIVQQKNQILAKLFEYEKICRKQHQEIYIQRKSLENLREKKYREYLAKKKKRENKFYDDIIVTQSCRNKKNETFLA